MKALIVGAGKMGSFHARVLRDLGYTTTTVDPDPAKCADYRTIREALLAYPGHLLSGGFDIAAIACPPEYLLDSAFQLAGMRMLVEKPFATNSRDAAMLGAYLKAAGAPVCVGFVERFNPRFRDLQALRNRVIIKRLRFTRWNDRPSPDVLTDLRLHDVDLARVLCVGDHIAEFDTRAEQSRRVRHIQMTYCDPSAGAEQRRCTFDLMEHNQSPLHALWHAFLTGQKVPTPDDAVRALQIVETMRGADVEELAA